MNDSVKKLRIIFISLIILYITISFGDLIRSVIKGEDWKLLSILSLLLILMIINVSILFDKLYIKEILDERYENRT